MKQDFAKLGIYSNNSYLSSYLKEKFIEKNLGVTLFDNLISVDYQEFDYLIFDFVGNLKKLSEIKKILTSINCKTIILVPRYISKELKNQYDSILKDLQSVNTNTGIILLPEIIGESVKFDEDFVSHNLIRQTILSERIKVNRPNKLINLISLSKLTEVIIKDLFSFGIPGQIMALSGYNRSPKSLLIKYLGISENSIIYTNSTDELVELNKTNLVKVTYSLRLAIRNTRKEFLSSINNQVIPKPLPKRVVKVKYSRFFIRLLIVIVTIFLVPLIVLLISISLFFLSYKMVFKDLSISEKLINVSINAAIFTKNFNLGIPIYFKYGDLTVKSAEIYLESLKLARTSTELLSRVTSDDVYDVVYFADSISGSIEKLYIDLSFLQSDVNKLNLPLSGTIKEYRQKILDAKLLFSRLSTLLGTNKPVKYLVIFQNNMELRPTGGFIGSFAIVTLDKGKISEIVVNDVYTADGQLKGHVDPPEPIRVHLGEGGWYLRDANWDPDFPTSAGKIEWFLDKEINIAVDGVIGIDLFFIKNLLEITGPITLSDFGKVITAENFYQTIQTEVEVDFFPGSIKKASFLTSLTKELIELLQDLPSSDYYTLFNSIYSSLSARHIQIYLHDLNAQSAISNLGYSGEVLTETDCGPRCFADFYSLIDANLGVNKANQFIKRSHDLSLKLSKNNISHELLVTYENGASQLLGNSGNYKSYTRLVIPKEGSVKGVRIYDAFGGSEDLNYDTFDVDGRREIGFLINLLPKETKKVQIAWNEEVTKFEKGGEYRLLIRKQAGTDSDNLKVSISGTDLALTKDSLSVYTTNLSRDFEKVLFITPK